MNNDKDNLEIKYKFGENLYIVGGKKADKVIKSLEKKKGELNKRFWELSNHLD